MGREQESSFSPPIETSGGSSSLPKKKEYSKEFIDAHNEYIDLFIEKGEKEAEARREELLSSVSEEEVKDLGVFMDSTRELFLGYPERRFQPPSAKPLPIKSLKKAS